MYFKNYTMPQSYLLSTVTEAFCNPIDYCGRAPSVSSTTNTSKRTPSGFCYVIVDSHGKAIKQSVLCTDRNVIYKFLTSLLD